VGNQTNPDLEARIAANLEDRDAYLVYGDWLSERGDPRGELIALQAKPNPDDATKEREQALLAANRDAWLGELAKLDPKKELHVTWRWGFIDAVRLGPELDSYDTAKIEFADTYAKVLQLPGIQFLRSLTFGAKDFDDYPTSWSDCIEALQEHGVPPALQKLAFSRGGYWDISSTELGDLSLAYPQLAKLRELSIELGAMELGVMDLPALQKLEIVTGGLAGTNLKSIASARWPALETLSLCIGETDNDYGCDVQMSDIEPILVAENLPKVKHLGLANSSLADEIAKALVTSRILPRLETLDLSKGTLSDDGARTLIDNWSAFSHLKAIDLSHAYLSDAVAEQLRNLKGPTITLDDLQDGDEEYRYCTISE
jgi:uncharacterized protein (TIGR02996 family)